MNNSKIENVQPEQVNNSEQKADGQQVSPSIANALVISRFLQPSDIDNWLVDKMKDKRINDEFGWTGEYRMCQKDLLDCFIDLQVNNELVRKQKDYIRLLIEELDEVVRVAAIHGWKSCRVEQGEKLRNEIASLNG